MMATDSESPFANGVSLRPRSLKKRSTSGSSGDGEELLQSERYHCVEPGCKRTFAELWRLKVHCRASPDVRGSGRERGHGKELSHCPKCHEALQPGKHHIGCAAGRSAPRQAAKRLKSLRGANSGDPALDLDRRHSSGSMLRMSSANSSGTFWSGDLGSPVRDAHRRQHSRFASGSGFAGPAEAALGDYQSSLQFQSAYAQAWTHLRPGGGNMERVASEPLPRFQPFSSGGGGHGEHGMGHYDPSLLQAAQAAMPQRMESKGSTDLDTLQAQQAQQARSNLQYGSRAFSMPIPGGGLPPPYGGPGLTFANPGGSSGHASATAAATAALQASVTGGFRAAPVSDPLGALVQQSWSLPYSLQRTSAFGDAAPTTTGFNGRVVSPQPRYPLDGSGMLDDSASLWGSIKAAAGAAGSRPPIAPANGFNQNDAALRFLQSQRMQQGGPNTAVADAGELYTNAADLLSKAGMSGSEAARLADQWGAQEPDSFAATDVKPLFGNTPKWNPLPQRDVLSKGGGGHGSMLGGGGGGDAAAGGGCKDAGSGGVIGAPELKPPSPLDAFKLPVELEAGGGFGGMPPAGSDGLSAAAVGGFADAAAQPFTL